MSAGETNFVNPFHYLNANSAKFIIIFCLRSFRNWWEAIILKNSKYFCKKLLLCTKLAKPDMLTLFIVGYPLIRVAHNTSCQQISMKVHCIFRKKFTFFLVIMWCCPVVFNLNLLAIHKKMNEIQYGGPCSAKILIE